MSIGTSVIELRFKKKNKMDKMGKLFLGVIFPLGVFFTDSFHMFSAVKSSKVKMT